MKDETEYAPPPGSYAAKAIANKGAAHAVVPEWVYRVMNVAIQIQSANARLASSGIASQMTRSEAEAFEAAADYMDYLQNNVFDPLTVSPLASAGVAGKLGAKGLSKGLRALIAEAALTKSGTPFLTKSMQRAIAAERGWVLQRGLSHDQPVFKVGKKYVS